MRALEKGGGDLGRDSVDEIAAARKAHAAETLEGVVRETRESEVSIRIDSIERILELFRQNAVANELPWQRASVAARLVRDLWGISQGPVTNPALSDLLHVPEKYLEYTPSNGLPFAAGLRAGNGAEGVKIAMRAKMQTGRRFEILRLVADSIAGPSNDSLLPATMAKTDRQKFQRAFAQEFLMPFHEIRERLDEQQAGETEIGDDEIDDIALEYDVSPLLVRTVLVNRGYLPREVLECPM